MKKFLIFSTVSFAVLFFLVSWESPKGKKPQMEKVNASLEISAAEQRRLADHFQTLYNTNGNFLTKVVKVKVSDIRGIIEGLDGNETLDLFFAAYQQQDLERYQVRHPDMTSVTDIPTLIIGNATRYSENRTYYDIGTFCPPPEPCNVSYE